MATKQQMEELKILRDAMVANFREQMKLRYDLNIFIVLVIHHYYLSGIA